MSEEWKTACPLNCYDVCGFIVKTEGNQVVSIEGDPLHPITKGKICGRGKELKNRIYDSRRTLYPLKKIEGAFQRISWEQAFGEISEKMKSVKEQYGPTAVLHSYDYASGGLLKELDKRFFNLFGGMTETVGSLCWGAGIAAQAYDFGEALSHHVEDTLNAKTIVVWGRNITTTNMHLYPFIQQAKENGAILIVIDPIQNRIAKQANLHLAITPGTDGLLALALSKIIVDNNWQDKNFIEKYTIGYQAFIKEIERINVDEISKEIKIEKAVLEKLAKVYADKSVMTFLGLGMQRYENGGNTIRAIDALHALTGNIGEKGSGINYANQQIGRSFDWERLLAEDKREAYRTFARPSQAEELLMAVDPPIKMIFISRSNMVSQLPNTSLTIKALETVETKVVMDMYMTETAKMADYFLPIASVFEEEDIYYGSMFHQTIRYGPKLLTPLGEAKSDLDIWIGLAEKLELSDFVKTREEYFELALTSLNHKGITLEKLKKDKQMLIPTPSVPWQNKVFKTESGKFEFYSEKAKKNNLPGTAIVAYPKESVQKNPELKEIYPYNLLSIHPNKSLHSQHFLLQKEELDAMPIFVSRGISNKYGIQENDQIEVYNGRGIICGRARINEGLNENTIYLEEGWWNQQNQTPNKLTSNQLSDMGMGSILYDNAVAIRLKN